MFTTEATEKLLSYADNQGWNTRVQIEAKRYVSNNYKTGLQDERRVRRYLSRLGTVTESTQEQDMLEDIDLFLDGESVSVKAQHSGIKYNNIYFEFSQYDSWNSTWVPSWYTKGTAKWYAILQGNILHMYLKEDIVKYVNTHGWNYERSLSAELHANQVNSGKRYQNAKCGYLTPDCVPHNTYILPKSR